MKRSIAAASVGLFILAAFGILLVSNRRLGSDRSAREGYEVFAHFDEVSGLVEGSEIRMRGFPVGWISKIGLKQDARGSAVPRVDIWVRRDIALREGDRDPSTGAWRNGAMLMRRQASLLGDYYLELLPGVQGKVLQPGEEIRLVQSRSGLEKVLANMDDAAKIIPKIDRIASDIQAVTANIRKVFGAEGGRSRLERISEDIGAAASDIRQVAGTMRAFSESSIFHRNKDINRIINNVATFTKNAARLSGVADRKSGQILDDVHAITRTVRELVTGQASDVERSIGSIKGTLEAAERALNQLDTVLGNIAETTATVNRGEGSIGRLVKDDTLVRGIEGVVEDVRDLTGRIRRLDVGWGVRAEYNFRRRAVKTYFSFKLQPDINKYYLLQIIDDPRGSTTRVRRVTETNDPTLPPALFEDVTETSGRLKVSLQFARRFGPFTGRLGLFENTGGLAADLQLFGDSLRFSAETFEWTADVLPRLKVWASWNFMRNLAVVGGSDFLLNNSTRDFFAGLFLTFTDNDLKALFAASPSVTF